MTEIMQMTRVMQMTCPISGHTKPSRGPQQRPLYVVMLLHRYIATLLWQPDDLQQIGDRYYYYE
jgi:hypothetical protein